MSALWRIEANSSSALAPCKASADAEGATRRMLRSRQFDGLTFRRQVPLGSYIADFVRFSHRIIVECDGGQHTESEYDEKRDAWLTSQGFSVLRFWKADILREPDGVERSLLHALGRQPSSRAPDEAVTAWRLRPWSPG